MKTFFLHGMGGSPADWEEVLAHCPGQALSLPRNLDFEGTARALAGEMRSASPFAVCGYSLGGRLAIRAASHLRDSGLRGIILLAAGLGFRQEETRRDRREKDRNWAEIARRKENFWEKWYAQELFSTFADLPATRRDAWLKLRYAINIETLCHQIEGLSPANHAFLEPELLALPNAKISVLYIAGERDKNYLHQARQLAERGIPVKTLAGIGHALPLEAPKEVAEIVTQFCKAHRE